MPHHTAKSWAQHLRSKLDNDIEMLRKRAAIQHRKNLAATNLPPSDVSSTSHLTGQQRAEIEILIDFFVHDEVQAGEEDEMRWQRLSAKVGQPMSLADTSDYIIRLNVRRPTHGKTSIILISKLSRRVSKRR